jgi:shikimate dehydrogenase
MKEVYTLADLESRVRLDAGCEKPARLAVIGQPIAHSASPRMHQAALDAAGISARYIRLEVAPGHVGEAFARMRALGFVGCNVTVPNKLEAMTACSEVHENAQMLGAVNTIRFDADKTRGFNTDGPGFARAIEDEFRVKFGSLTVSIVGAGGGAGGAIATQACLSGVRKLVLINRTLSKIEALAERLEQSFPETDISVCSLVDCMEYCLGCDLIVNTSSVGLKEGETSLLHADCFKQGQFVYDTIYQPPITPLLAMARAEGCLTANGFSMLIQQGALAFQYWFPGTDPLTIMQAAMRG